MFIKNETNFRLQIMHIIQQPAFKLPRFANDQWINTESIYFLKSLRIFKLQNNKLLD